MRDKTFTAEELRSNKTQAMALAYSGKTVKITNVRFPGGHFELRFVKPEQEQPEKREQIQELSMEEKRNPPKLLKRFTYSGEAPK